MEPNDNSTFQKEFCGKWDWSEYQSDVESSHGWWIHGIVSLIVGLIGIGVNVIFIRVLTCQEFRKILFNKLIMCLTLSDILFLSCSAYDSLRLHLLDFDYCSIHGYVQLMVYPFRKITMCFSAYMTVVLSFERFQAITNPIKHRNRGHIGRAWVGRFLIYVSPAFIVSMLPFGTPLFFAFRMKGYPKIIDQNETANNALYNTTSELETMETEICLSVWWRLDKNYILLFNTIGTFVITGVIPFLLLTIFNYKIYKSIRFTSKQNKSLNIVRHSTRFKNRSVENRQLEEKRNEILQSMVLFGIFISFFVCHILRVVLNLEEIVYFDELTELEAKENKFDVRCKKVQFWTAIASDISHLLLQVSASINFFIYGYLSKKFKTAIKNQVFRCNMLSTEDPKEANTDSMKGKNNLPLREIKKDSTVESFMISID